MLLCPSLHPTYCALPICTSAWLCRHCVWWDWDQLASLTGETSWHEIATGAGESTVTWTIRGGLVIPAGDMHSPYLKNSIILKILSKQHHYGNLFVKQPLLGQFAARVKVETSKGILILQVSKNPTQRICDIYFDPFIYKWLSVIKFGSIRPIWSIEPEIGSFVEPIRRLNRLCF